MTEETDDAGTGDQHTSDDTGDLPPDVVAEAERLTHLARETVDDAEATAYRQERASLLVDYEYTARIREDDTRNVLVLYPEEWVEDGLVQVEKIQDTDRGVERPLDGPGEADDWDEIDAHNRAIAERVEDEHGEVHGANAAAFADFMGNHYARPLESATKDEIQEFLTEYYPRNAWPSDRERDAVQKSVQLALDAGESVTRPVR